MRKLRHDIHKNHEPREEQNDIAAAGERMQQFGQNSAQPRAVAAHGGGNRNGRGQHPDDVPVDAAGTGLKVEGGLAVYPDKGEHAKNKRDGHSHGKLVEERGKG